MAKLKLEYIWLDGYEPVANLRSKTKIVDGDPETFTLADCPMWGFDGSSTQQADGSDLTTDNYMRWASMSKLLGGLVLTLALQKGISILAVQKILGHDKLSTTAIYLNLTNTHVLEEYSQKW